MASLRFTGIPSCTLDRCDSTSTRSRHTSRITAHHTTSHSQCRRWISQAPTRDTSGSTTYQKQPFPCRCSAQFHKHSFETHMLGIIAFERNPLLHAGSMRSSHPLVLKWGYLNPSSTPKVTPSPFFIPPGFLRRTEACGQRPSFYLVRTEVLSLVGEETTQGQHTDCSRPCIKLSKATFRPWHSWPCYKVATKTSTPQPPQDFLREWREGNRKSGAHRL